MQPDGSGGNWRRPPGPPPLRRSGPLRVLGVFSGSVFLGQLIPAGLTSADLTFADMTSADPAGETEKRRIEWLNPNQQVGHVGGSQLVQQRRYTGEMEVINQGCSAKPKVFGHFNKVWKGFSRAVWS